MGDASIAEERGLKPFYLHTFDRFEIKNNDVVYGHPVRILKIVWLLKVIPLLGIQRGTTVTLSLGVASSGSVTALQDGHQTGHCGNCGVLTLVWVWVWIL